jgi:hypothetical protein
MFSYSQVLQPKAEENFDRVRKPGTCGALAPISTQAANSWTRLRPLASARAREGVAAAAGPRWCRNHGGGLAQPIACGVGVSIQR